MPQISKIRIVNFNYNDGKRLIADELFDLESKENNDALNVLINLANGGGKSVLVQLMMQPIIPKAKVAGRRIESFFKKISDHCFVLLEWIKDNSKEKLMTGIAMASSEASTAEGEEGRGIAIKFYTFFANYSGYTTNYDIINMPLSKKESGRFIVADFDTVRQLARNSRGFLNYYSSDDMPSWKKKLAEYGLIQSEWKMIETLNSEEGGLGKFFGDFKNSNQLIDRLLIPTIEEKLNQSNAHGKEDTSLSTMLLSYARQYASQQDVLQEKETFEAFARGLAALKPVAIDLWNSNDALENCIRNLFGLSDALEAKLIECQKLQKEYAEKEERNEEQQQHIEHERLSLTYYESRDDFDRVVDEYNQAKHNEESISDQLKAVQHKKAILECAEYYQRLLRINGEIEGLQSEISRQQSGGSNAEEIANLKYSVYVQICTLLAHNTAVLGDLEVQLASHHEQFDACTRQSNVSKRRYEESIDAYTRADERLRIARCDTDNQVVACNLEVMRRLDGAYATEEILEIERDVVACHKEAEEALQNAEADLLAIEGELETIPQRKAELSVQQTMYEKEQAAFIEELKEFLKLQQKVQSICNEHTLDYTLRFTGHIQEYLASSLFANQAHLAEVLRKISIADEEITSAKRGSLHVPHAVIEYLNSTGVQFTTCEKYLSDQVADGKISREQCLDILRNYPAAAFGVLMDAHSKEKFFAYGREKWLPAMIPLFTYEQMDAILRNEKKFDGAIAFYSEEYFADTARYIAQLEDYQTQLFERQRILNATQKSLEEQLRAAQEFAAFEASYEDEIQSAITKTENEIQRIVKDIAELSSLETRLKESKTELKEKSRETARRVELLQKRLDVIVSIIKKVGEEVSLAEALGAAQVARNQAQREHNEIVAHCNNLHESIDQLSMQRKNLQGELDELNAAKSKIGTCPEATQISGDWRQLLARYETLQLTLSKELDMLQAQIAEKNNRRNENQREIERREISVDEYACVSFSDEQLSDARQKEKQFSVWLTEASRIFNEATVKFGKAEGKLDAAKKELLRFAGPLDRADVGGDFESRLKKLKKELCELRTFKAESEKFEQRIESTLGRLLDLLKNHPCPASVPTVQLSSVPADQFNVLRDDYHMSSRGTQDLHIQVENMLREMQTQFKETTCGVLAAVTGMTELLANRIRGDRYYTLTEHIEAGIQNAHRAISKISTDLVEFENSRNDLVRQCTLQGKQIYDGLRQMASSSRVTVYEGESKRHMIRFDIPSEIDAVIATSAIADEINKGTRELVSKITDEAATEHEIKKIADRLVGSKNLLRKYIGKESLQVEAYKIDQNPQNAGYRSWEDTQVNNSGAEKFVVYFAVILSLMNYTRGDFGSIRDKELRSTLILDNPFGATSSRHILIPMFAIAKHFRVQMICLSDINKSDVINCFDVVIKAIIKRRPMSNNEMLTHEGNEAIEHGYYRSEQLSLI